MVEHQWDSSTVVEHQWDSRTVVEHQWASSSGRALLNQMPPTHDVLTGHLLVDASLVEIGD